MPMRHLSRIVPGKAAVLLFCFCAWIFFPHSELIPCILNTVHPLIPPAPKVCDIFAVLRVMLLAVRAEQANITLLWSSRVFFRNQRGAQKSTRGISPACGRFFSCFISAGVNIFFNLTGRVCFCKFIQHCKNIIGMV